MNTTLQPVRIAPGEFGRAVMPASECCMHMRITGTAQPFQLRRSPSGQVYVQLYTADLAHEYSGPLTTGEAGVYHDCDGYYYYPDETAYLRAWSEQQQAEQRARLEAARSEAAFLADLAGGFAGMSAGSTRRTLNRAARQHMQRAIAIDDTLNGGPPADMSDAELLAALER